MTQKTKIISVVFMSLALAGAAYFAINGYQNAKMDKLNSELFLTKPSNLSTYEDLYRYLANNGSLTMGEVSGYRQELAQRNHRIKEEYQSGISMECLSEKYCLSLYTVRKIIYQK